MQKYFYFLQQKESKIHFKLKTLFTIESVK
jgi:hypothetical protein